MDSIFNIDRSSLDEEWAGQPELFYTHAEKLAFAKKELEHRRAQVDIAKAKVSLDVRRNPKEYKIDCRLTDKLIEQVVTVDVRVRRATAALQTSQHAVNILQAAVQALDHRKRALEGLVSLHGQGYFAAPRVKGESNEIVHEMEKRSARRKGIRDRKIKPDT